MKNLKNKLSVLLIMAFIFTSAVSVAQRGNKQIGPKGENTPVMGKCNFNFLELSQEQESKIDKIKLDADKKIIPLRNEIREKKAKLLSLQTSEKVNESEVNSIIDEISNKQAEIHKIKAKKHQEIRMLLDDDQKVIFDKHFSKRGMRGNCCGSRHGYGPRGGGKGNYPNCPRR